MKKEWDKLGKCNVRGKRTGLPVKQVIEYLRDHRLSVKVTDSLDFGVKDIWIEKGNKNNAKNLLRLIGVTVGVTLRW